MSHHRQRLHPGVGQTGGIMTDFEARYAAIASRDSRYDGQFFTAVRSTGIYCRPSCPARTPARRNVTFYATAAAAQQAGYRSCKRCLPHATPGSPQWNIGADVASRAMRLIDDGLVEREGVEALADRLGYSRRHLTRVLVEQVGAGPQALAIAHRLDHARALLEATDLPVVDVAHTAGFGSVRQFNDAAKSAWGVTPSHLRSGAAARAGSRGTPVEVRLRVREPYDAPRLLSFLSERAIDGVERVAPGGLTRALRLPSGPALATYTASAGPRGTSLAARFVLQDAGDLPAAIARSRRLFDADADPIAVRDALSQDARLAGAVARAPGLRVPGAVDPFEMIVRAVVGQQISVSGARTALGRIVARHGDEVDFGDESWLAFPTPEALADVDPQQGLMPASRWRTIGAVARAILDGELETHAGADRASARRALLAIPGIGPWTADYVMMRAYGDPDAIPVGDLVLRRAAGLEADALEEESRSWSPWRAYAAMHLWTAFSERR